MAWSLIAVGTTAQLTPQVAALTSSTQTAAENAQVARVITQVGIDMALFPASQILSLNIRGAVDSTGYYTNIMIQPAGLLQGSTIFPPLRNP